MGVYVYTLRKNPIIAIDTDYGKSITLGRVEFAYKVSWSGGDPQYKRTTARLHSLAEKAREANPDLELVTIGNPKDHDFSKYGPMGVYLVKDHFTSYYDTDSPGKYIGLLHKNGKTYNFERIDV